jgi:hypothetical protein
VNRLNLTQGNRLSDDPPVVFSGGLPTHRPTRRMGSFLKALLVLAILAGLVVAGLVFLGGGAISHLDSAAYRPSDELLFPSEISKNPYKYEGRSGILDTMNVLILMGGRKTRVPYPGGSLVFVNMLDEHTAVFDVRISGQFGEESSNQIAVKLEDSNPPEPMRPWRVYVEGPIDATNGLGATVSLASVRFEGYADPPVRPVTTEVPETPSRESAPNTQPATSDVDVPATQDAQPPAPIERRPPPTQNSTPQ